MHSFNTVKSFAPDVLRNCRITHALHFRQIFAFAMMFDHHTAAAMLADIDDARVEWSRRNVPWKDLTDAERSRTIVDLFRDIATQIALEMEGRNFWLGYSSGFDSRLIHYGLRLAGTAPKTFTFGQAGNADFDFARLSARRCAVESMLIDTSEIEWRLEDFDFHTPALLDRPPSPRLVSALSLMKQGDYVELHGYLNDALTGSHDPKTSIDNWDSAVDYFLGRNDQFKFQRFVDRRTLRNFLPRKPPDFDLPYHTALDLAYRQHQRIHPRDYAGVAYCFPFTDRRWIGLWLNMPPHELAGQARYLDTLSMLDGPEFFDLREFKAQGLPLTRTTRMEFLYGPRQADRRKLAETEHKIAPHGATAHFDYHACYVNNRSFRSMIDESMSRLRARNIFHASFLEYTLQKFIAADSDAARMIPGMMTIDICIESGIVSP